MAEIKTTLVFDTDTQSFRAVENDSKKLGRNSGKNAGESFSKSFSQNTEKGFQASFARLRTAAIAAAGAVAAAFAGREVVAAANRQEDAVRRLETSLARIGEGSIFASRDLQQFAAQLQRTIGVADELVLEQLAIAQSFGATAEQSKELITASLNLSAAQGKTLEESVRLLSKTYGGYAGELGEILPAVKELTQEQLRQGEVVTLVNRLYGNFAQQNATTFSKSIERLSNNFGDLTEEVGFFVTKSESGISIADRLSNLFADAATSLKDFRLEFQEFNSENAPDKINALQREISQLNTAIATGEKITKKFAGTFFEFLSPDLDKRRSELAQLTLEIQRQGSALEKRAFLPGLNEENKALDENTGKIKLNNEQLSSRIANIGLSSTEALRNQLNQEFTLLQEAKNRQLITEQDFQTRLAELRQSFANQTGNGAGAQISLLAQQFPTFAAAVKEGLDEATAASKQFDQSLRSIGAQARSQIAVSLAGALAKASQALFSGEDGLKSFGDNILAFFGDLAIQLSGLFASLAATYAFSGVPVLQALAAPLAGAAAALAVVGGALKAFGPSSNTDPTFGGANPAGVVGGGVGIDEPGLAEPVQNEQEQRSVNLTINGDVLDSRETSLRIVELINQATENEGAIITGIT